MAFQRDYVLRMIEMMGEFFRRLCQRVDEKERLLRLNQMSREQCGLSLDAAMEIEWEGLKALLPQQGLLMLSELLYLRAQVVTDMEEARQAFLLRSLRLLASLDEEEALCVERSQRLREMMDACERDLTAEDYMACARFFLAGEHFDHGEDAIFLSVETALTPGPWIAQGIALLQGLLSLPDGTLIPGGLPREDVLQAIEDLEAWEKA